MFQSRGAKCLACDAVFCCPSHRRKHEISIHNFVFPKNPLRTSSREVAKGISPRSNRPSLIKSVLCQETRKCSNAARHILRSLENTDRIPDRIFLKAKRKWNHGTGSAVSLQPVEDAEAQMSQKPYSDTLPNGRGDPTNNVSPSSDDQKVLTPVITSPPVGDGEFITSTPLTDQEKETPKSSAEPYDTPATTHIAGTTTAVANAKYSRLPPTPLQSSGQKRKLSLTTEYFSALDELPLLSRESPLIASTKKPKFARVFSRITSFVRNIFHTSSISESQQELSWAVPKSPSRRKKARMFLSVTGRKSYRKDV